MATKRRHELQLDLTKSLNNALDQLAAIWEEIGIVEEQQTARIDVVMDHTRGLLTAMVEEEENLKDKLMTNVTRFGEELLHLCKELHRPPHEPPAGLTILQLERNLRNMVDRLNIEKHDRLKLVKRLKEQDQQLCDCLCTTPYYIPSGTIPSQDQIDELDKHVQDLELEKEHRFKLFKSTKDKIVHLLDDLERSPNSSLQREIVLEDEESFPLSADNMKALKRYHDELEEQQKRNFAMAAKLRDTMESLWERIMIPAEDRQTFSSTCTGFKPSVIEKLREEIARCEELKLQNMSSVIAATRKELQEWWAKCYYSDEQKRTFKHLKDTECTENLLILHEQEVEKVKEYYRQNQEMLEKVAKRQQLWADFQEFERKATDPLRFSNRGCNLLKEEKARKKLLRELPKVEEEVKEQIILWEQTHNRSFLVGGARFTDFINKQWEEYRTNKDMEKNQRNQKKVKELEEEMIYGSKPVTPGKRRFIGTPAKTPTSKHRKLNSPPSSQQSSDNDNNNIPTSSSSQQHLSIPPQPREFTHSSLSSTVSANNTTRASNTNNYSKNSSGGSSINNSRKKTPRYLRAKPKTTTTVNTTKVDTTKMNDTNARTPLSASHRMHRSNFNSIYSPAVNPVPRSAGPKTPHRPRDLPPRKALMEKTNSSEQPTFSQTRVAGPTAAPATSASNDVSDTSSLASLGPYHEFAKGLNMNSRQNCRSSVMPDKAAFF